jgi:hypothetical protein
MQLTLLRIITAAAVLLHWWMMQTATRRIPDISWTKGRTLF